MPWFTRRKSDTMETPEPAPAVSLPPMEKTLTHHQWAGRRDAFIVDLIRRFGLLTSDLIQWRVGLEQFGNLTSTHNILTRLKVLKDRGEIYAVSRAYNGSIVYAPRPLRGTAKRHISHDSGPGRFGITLEGVAKARPELGFREWCSDQVTLQDEFKHGERPFIPDARFVLGDFQNFLEYHTGSQDSETKIVAKMRAHKRHHEQLKELVKIDSSLSSKMRVLFVCTQEKDVDKLAGIVVRTYGESLLFWAGWERAYREEPQAVLGKMWRVAQDVDLRGLV